MTSENVTVEARFGLLEPANLTPILTPCQESWSPHEPMRCRLEEGHDLRLNPVRRCLRIRVKGKRATHPGRENVNFELPRNIELSCCAKAWTFPAYR